jgi:hypothetical protein
MLWRSPSPKRQPTGFIEPCIPTQADKPPTGPDWIHEIKHDGYRMIVRKTADRVRLFTRRGYRGERPMSRSENDFAERGRCGLLSPVETRFPNIQLPVTSSHSASNRA